MISVLVLYANKPGSRFDIEYYTSRHLPLVRRLLEPMGMRSLSYVTERALDPTAPSQAYRLIAELRFDDMETTRAALEAHEFADLITLVEGDSASSETINRVKAQIGAEDSVMLMLDSNHSKAHVLAELSAYSPLIRPGGYIIVADGVMATLASVPKAHPDWAWDNPKAAVAAFLAQNPDFERAAPPCPFNEGGVPTGGSYWSDGYLRRVR